MSSKVLMRIAAGFVLFFAVGHTVGHLNRYQVSDTQGKEVLRAMREYQFDMFGQPRSYDENYTGMSLNLILTLLTFVTILWLNAGNNETRALQVNGAVGVCLLGFSVTGFLYFFPLPAITCLIAAVLIFISIAKQRKTR
jgi:hypothetical protein